MSLKKPKKKTKAGDTYHHGDLREAMIAAGLEILKKEGAHRLSLREAARHVGVSHMAPYRHFPDKEALIAAIAQEGFARLGEKLEAVITENPGAPEVQLESAAVAYVRFALDHTEHLRMMFGGFVGDREKYPAMREMAHGTFDKLVRIVRECQAKATMRPGAPEQMALAAWSSVHGLAMLIVENQLNFLGVQRAQAEAISRQVIQTVIAGLAK